MDAVFALGEATVNQIVETIPDRPMPRVVRRMMHILEEKGQLKRQTGKDAGGEVVYRPTKTRAKAGQSAFQKVLETFLGGSLEDALAAHLVSR